ncbi:hypothetical protein GGR53DRAFT_455884 [Hypoxylon sp. FL1150]|nr:hypothetical protein GGR53DRAFT_455884 [Hypoxylon sp. FL1150]
MSANANIDDTNGDAIKARSNERIRQVIKARRAEVDCDIKKYRRDAKKRYRLEEKKDVEAYTRQRTDSFEVSLRKELDAIEEKTEDELKAARVADQGTSQGGNGLDGVCTTLYGRYYRPTTSVEFASTTRTGMSPELGNSSPNRGNTRPKKSSASGDEWTPRVSSDEESIAASPCPRKNKRLKREVSLESPPHEKHGSSKTLEDRGPLTSSGRPIRTSRLDLNYSQKAYFEKFPF